MITLTSTSDAFNGVSSAAGEEDESGGSSDAERSGAVSEDDEEAERDFDNGLFLQSKEVFG